MNELDLQIEALLFASPEPVSVADLHRVLKGETALEKNEIQESVDRIVEKFKVDTFAMEVKFIAEGYQFFTKSGFQEVIEKHLKVQNRKKLTRATLETLSVIAYKQPVSKSIIESIRGVSSDHAIQKLLDKDLVTVLGRSEGPGRPILYGTSKSFVNYFGLSSIKDLPQLKDIVSKENNIGNAELN